MASTLFKSYVLLIVLCIGITLIHKSQSPPTTKGNSEKTEKIVTTKNVLSCMLASTSSDVGRSVQKLGKALSIKKNGK
ncbi:unnamed protein product [Macrosiphum euphorbiae]|uniref:Uncharacterized protein n=1 Tax=Macrosiphum euphorbiae TaxID=13131 RepID=A0AAV0XIM5_9HEMI|nr:unnamed protein product [Macrosiphum euphorbiae]